MTVATLPGDLTWFCLHGLGVAESVHHLSAPTQAANQASNPQTFGKYSRSELWGCLTPSPPWGYYLTYRVPHLKKREKEELKPELYTERCRNIPGISPAVKRKWDVACKCSVFGVTHSLHASVCLYQREARCIYQSVTSDLFDSAGQREGRERCLVMSI